MERRKFEDCAIRIVNDGLLPRGVRIETADGAEIRGVRETTIKMRMNEVVVAELEILVSAVDVTAHPLLGLDTIRHAAAAHGYNLVKKDDEGPAR